MRPLEGQAAVSEARLAGERACTGRLGPTIGSAPTLLGHLTRFGPTP